jgi:hypothetical protein
MGSAITRETYLAWFSVNTKHGGMLEFVLDQAWDRKNCEVPSYYDLLFNMLEKEFQRNKGVRPTEYSAYGSVMYCIEAQSPEQLSKALARCEKVVLRWINKYRINRMRNN